MKTMQQTDNKKGNNILPNIPLAFFLSILSLTLVSCPEPITLSQVDNTADKTAPTITITMPADYASFSRTILINGSVNDLAESGKKGRVETLTYEIYSHTSAKPVTIGSSGTFQIQEPNDLRENIVLLLKATDWNGNITEYRLPLTFPGNEIPSFAASEGNKEVQLNWSPVAGVTNYTLYFESSARTPDPATSPSLSGLSAPYTMNQLKNGTLYSFLLEGTTSEGKKNYSTVVRSIPLSTLHLFPRISSYFNSIEVTWRTFSAIQSYDVLRALSPDGPWESVSGPVSAPPFRDSSVSSGTTYYYAVKPAAYSSVKSEWVEAQADPAASRADASTSSFAGVSFATSSIWRDNYLYVADYYYGLRVIDVSNPSYPTEKGKVAISSSREVFLQGDYAFIAAWKSLYIVNIANPAAPVITGSIVISSSSNFQAEGVAVLGDLAFVAGFNEGFAVIDVSNKGSPVVRISNRDGTLFQQNYEVTVQDRSGVKILAVAGLLKSALYTIGGTTSAPTVTLMSSAMGGSRSLAFSGTILYSATGNGVDSYQTSALASPVQLDMLYMNGLLTQSVVVYGTRLFIALYGYGYAVINASNPANLSTVRMQTVPGTGDHVEVGGGYAYVSAGYNYGLPIYGANDPSAASLVLTLTNVKNGGRIAAYRNYLYVSEYYDSGSGYPDWHAASYDITTPVTTFRFNGNIGNYAPYDFSFAGTRSYLANERMGVMMWNAANVGSPTVLQPGYVSIPGGNAWSIALTGNYALIGLSNSTLASVDLSRSDALTIVNSVQTQGTLVPYNDFEVRGIAIKNNLAFLANEQGGLRVVDVTDPTFPVALSGFGALPAGGSAAAIALAGDFAFVADSTNGLLVYDTATVRSWNVAGQPPVWQSAVVGATDVVIRGNYAYVAKPTIGLDIWDISNPRTPVLTGTLAASGFNPTRLALYGEYLYAINGTTKLYVVDLVP